MMVTRGKSKKFSITKSIHEVVVKPKEIPTSRRILVATHSFSFSLPPQPLHCSGGRFLVACPQMLSSMEQGHQKKIANTNGPYGTMKFFYNFMSNNYFSIYKSLKL